MTLSLVFVTKKKDEGRNSILKRETRKLIIPVLLKEKKYQFVAHWKHLSEEEAVVVFSSILPNNPTKFLLLLLLTFGDFDTELDILNVQTFKEAYITAKVLSDSTVSEETVKELTKKYLLQQLRFTPGSSKLIDTFLLMAESVLAQALLKNSLCFAAALPVVSDKSVLEECEETVAIQLVIEKSKMVAYLQTCQTPLPIEQTMLEATVENPVPWKPIIQKSPDQSKDSYLEQSRILNKLIISIDMYKRGHCTFIRHQIIFGPPGSGKTFVMLKSLAYAICQGLNCVVTSLAAERSAALAGKHLNALIPFPVENYPSAESLSKKALSNLQRSPIKSRILQNLDVFFLKNCR